ANLSSSREGIKVLIEKSIDLFRESGLSINPSKSVCICIESGKLVADDLILGGEIKIPALKENDTVRYLGVDFSSQITFNHAKMINNTGQQIFCAKDFSTVLGYICDADYEYVIRFLRSPLDF